MFWSLVSINLPESYNKTSRGSRATLPLKKHGRIANFVFVRHGQKSATNVIYMEHLSLEIFDRSGNGSKYAYLPEDASITITDTSEVFASGDVWSLPFTLNVKANAAIFGTSGDIHGSRLHEQLNERRARLWVDGLPLYLGYLKLDDEVDVDEDGNVDVTFESGQKTFNELIEGGKANQVPMMSDVQIGMALWRKRWTCVEMQLTAKVDYNYTGSKQSWYFTNDKETILTHTVDPMVQGDEDEQLTPFVSDGESDGTSVQLYPRMVFPKGTFYNMDTGKEETIDCLNTDTPYDDSHPYCNVALCYQKYDYLITTEENGVKYTHYDYTADPVAQRGYEVMPANRVNSAPNFFVIYWLKALMKHIGIHIDENQMMDIEDMRRLFFVNTNCVYEETKYLRNSAKYTGAYGKYQFGSEGPLVAEYFGDLQNEKFGRTTKRWSGIKKIAKPENCGLECSYTEGKWYEKQKTTERVNGTNVTTEKEVDVTDTVKGLLGGIKKITVAPKTIAGMSQQMRALYDGYGINGYGSDRVSQKNMLLHRAIASSECFPNEDISTVIKALENGFGIRLLFDRSYKRVRIVLLRNIFRDNEIQDITCDILGEVKTENCIRGFKMSYGDTENTEFYYKGLNDLLPHEKQLWIDKSDKHDYSYWDLDAKYADLLNKVSAFDKTCYIAPATGNAFGIKVDKDAKRYDDLHPSLFEFAGYMDAEDGDCTGEDETIDTINVGFKPAIMNDTNYEEERQGHTNQQSFALFVDETMRPRRPDLKDRTAPKSYNDSDAVYSTDKLYELHGNNGTEDKMVSDGVVMPGSFAVSSDMYVEMTYPKLDVSITYNEYPNSAESRDQTSKYRHKYYTTLTNLKISGHINEGYRLYLQDNFEPNDDGVCPIETHDWGLTLGIMRGSGSDAYVNYSNDPNDEEGNDTWDRVPGSSATAHSDTCDSYGNLWDYNGTADGVGDTDGRFSLKLRAEKLNPYYKKGSDKDSEKNQYLPITTDALKGRGLIDKFYKEYSYWIRNARIVNLTEHMTLAQFLTIDKTKKVRMGDYLGFIKKMKFTVSNQAGFGNVTVELMYI